MAVTTNTSGPYTAPAAVIQILNRYRERGLATPITLDVLLRAGISTALAPRTLQSLVVLDLIDDKGQPSQVFQKMREVPEADYKKVMAEWLKGAYAEVFSFVDPAVDDAVRIRDAFRSYQPHGQIDRMVTLFMGLCTEAGITPEGKKSEPRPTARRAAARPAQQQQPRSRTPAPAGSSGSNVNQPGLPPALSGILQMIPPGDTGWTKDVRDKFMTTFGAVLDFVVPIKTPDQIMNSLMQNVAQEAE